jgi:uncharacterized RDD family membrane protein YckC
MKCPKCGYLGFESVDRCRNCGYDFSLSPTADILELPLMTPAPAPLSLELDPPPAETKTRQPIDDLSFLDADALSEPVRLSSGMKPAAGGAAAVSAPADLPLFGATPDDSPLITKAPPPRPPLAVRRATPEAPRLRGVSQRSSTLDLGLELPPPTDGAGSIHSSTASSTEATEPNAGVGARLAAFVTDVVILAAIDAAVIYFTLQICGVGVEDIGILPRAPLFAFLFVQNGGYLVAFTAGGQTLGKMAVGIKVVPAEPRSSLDLGRAFLRELVWIVLAAPAGLGFLTVLSRDRRGVHDRFAGTRVVRA